MERLRFFQIPKTGGTTFTTILFRQYFGKKFFVFSGHNTEDKKIFDALPARAKDSIMLYTGHMPLISGIPQADQAKTITFLRDPVKRVKSFCQHVSEGKSEYLIRDFPPELFDLDQFLESSNIELANFQTRMLLGDNNYQTPYSFKDVTALQAKEDALDILFNRIALFGLQEYFDESLVMFSTALGWSLPFYTQKNVRSEKKQLHFEERHLKRIVELNAIDIEVYRVAEQEFLRRLQNPALFDNDKLKRLRQINQAFGSSLIPFLENISWMANRFSRPLMYSPSR